MVEQSFDVFLAHSSQDKPLIRQLYRKLKERGINPWLDEEEIAPGTSFQDEIQQAIAQIKTAAICIGQGGLGKWQTHELKALISQCVERSIPVIPVLLPGVEEIPENLLFLRQFNAVAFNQSMEDEQGFDRLAWGITRQKPQLETISQVTTSDRPQLQQVVVAHKEDQLVSERGIDYTRLRNLLVAQDWKAADQETYEVMIRAVNKNLGDWFTREELINFPDADLQTIDDLWVKYSDGRFGFSIQKKIYIECGGRLNSQCPGDRIWNNFGAKVGWRLGGVWLDYKDMPFNSLPKGSLPRWGVDCQVRVCGWIGVWGSEDNRFFILLSHRALTNHNQASKGISYEPDDDNLISERFDASYYARLRDLLKSGYWKAADQETRDRMFEVMNRQQEGWFRVEDIENFPCLDLRTIDWLWVKYSNGHFGFSIQAKIWQAYNSPGSYNQAWEKFGETVGWKNPTGWPGWNSWYTRNLFTFDLAAPAGHLPVPMRILSNFPIVGYGSWSDWGSVWSLFSRVKNCKL